MALYGYIYIKITQIEHKKIIYKILSQIYKLQIYT